jgi:hypothetical protein
MVVTYKPTCIIKRDKHARPEDGMFSEREIPYTGLVKRCTVTFSMWCDVVAKWKLPPKVR